MSRWAPNATGRLHQAALELFAERGYERTTVAQISARAGVSQRTFFRHFPDKRGALLAEDDRLRTLLIAGVQSSAASAELLETVERAVQGILPALPPRELIRRRQLLVAAHRHLRERELDNFASLGESLREALLLRGASTTEAHLTAGLGILLLRCALTRWASDRDDRPWKHHVQNATRHLRVLVAPPLRG